MKGSPAGILAIGVGIFLLLLGWSGKWADVLAALQGKISLPDNPLDHTPTKPPAENAGGECNNSKECPTGYQCIGNMCSKAPNQPPEPKRCILDDDCPTGQRCTGKDNRSKLCKPVAGPGEKCAVDIDCPTGYVCVGQMCSIAPGAGRAGMNWDELPTGYYGLKHVPRERSYP